MSVSRTDDCLEVSDKTVGNSLVKDVPGIVEAKQNKVRDSSSDLPMKSEHSITEMEVENLDNSSGSLLNVQSSLLGNAKGPGITSDHMSEIPKVNGVTSTTSQPRDHKAEDFNQSSEAASDSHMNKAGQLADDLCLLKSELEGTEGLMALHKSPRARKHGTAFPEEHAKPGGTVSSFRGLSGQRKMVACTGKPFTSTTTLIPKSSTFEQFKSANNRNPFAKSQNIHDCNVNVRKDRALQDEIRDENPRKTVKERPKSVGNPIPKPSNPSRITHDSVSRKSASEAKEIALSASSRSFSPSNATISSGSGESGVQLHHQRATTHMYNRSSASGLSQKCFEKPSQPNCLASAKINQNHVPSVCPPIPSSSPAALSDEEVRAELCFGTDLLKYYANKFSENDVLISLCILSACFVVASRTQQLSKSTSCTAYAQCGHLTSTCNSYSNKPAHEAGIKFLGERSQCGKEIFFSSCICEFVLLLFFN